MEIEIDRFEMARAQIAEVGRSCVLVSRFDVLEHCLLKCCPRLSTSQLSDMTGQSHPKDVLKFIAAGNVLHEYVACAHVHATTARLVLVHIMDKAWGIASLCFTFAEVFLHG